MKIFYSILILCIISCQSESSKEKKDKNSMLIPQTEIDFWNGNRSEIRQEYERAVLEAILLATTEQFGGYKIRESRKEYPGNEESKAFSEKQHDLLVTVAGNQKFASNDAIHIYKPIAKNLLGYRILIIRKNDAEQFSKVDQIEHFKKLKHGIPETWSDAAIFRENGFSVVEKGDFDAIFKNLVAKKFDYTAFGANEVNSIFQNKAASLNSLMIEQNTLLFYPFPLVFYVNPNQPELAKRIDIGIEAIMQSGELDELFHQFYAQEFQSLRLNERNLIQLKNHLIPEELAVLKPEFSYF